MNSGRSVRNARGNEDPYRNITDKDAKEWNESLRNYKVRRIFFEQIVNKNKNRSDAQYQIEVL